MTQTSWPFDGIDTTETQYSQLFRRMQMDGVWGAPGDTAVKVTADSTGMNVKIAAGYAFVRGHMYYNSDVLTLAVPVGDVGARTDVVVLRLDPTANTILPAIVKGVSGNSAAQPLNKTDAGLYDVPLARLAIVAGAATIAPAAVTDARQFAGQVFGLWTNDTRPDGNSVPPLRQGTAGFNSTTLRPEIYNGTGWTDFAPATVPVANLTGTLPVNKGGTGGTTAAEARTSLGTAATLHTHQSYDIIVPGTGGVLLTDWTSQMYASKVHTHQYSELFADGVTITQWSLNNFYTKGQDNDLLAGKANVSHGHTSDQITILGYNLTAVVNNKVDSGSPEIANKRGIGNGDFGAGTPIYTAYGRNNAVNSAYVSAAINGDGRLGINPSARRFKKNIVSWKESDANLDAFLDLDSKKYQLKANGPDSEVMIGFIAEDVVAAGFEELVPLDVDPESEHYNEPISIRYELMVVPLQMAASRMNRQIKQLEAQVAELMGA